MRHLSIVLFSALFLLCASAFGQAAKQHFFAGQSYYEQGRYQKAIGEFEEAYRLDPRPLLLFNISQAYERLGDLQQAVDYLQKFVEKDPKNDNIQTHRDKLRNLEQRIAKTGIAVTSNEADATIFIDDVEVGRTPHEGIIPSGVGAHVIRVSKPGYRDFVMNVAISWGYSVPIDAQLAPGAAVPVTTEPAETSPEYTAEMPEDEASSGGFTKALPWIVAGTGGALAIVGWAGLGIKAKNDGDTDLALVADILGFTGVALAVGGTVWGIVANSGGSDEDDLASGPGRLLVSPIVTHETVAFSASLRF